MKHFCLLFFFAFFCFEACNRKNSFEAPLKKPSKPLPVQTVNYVGGRGRCFFEEREKLFRYMKTQAARFQDCQSADDCVEYHELAINVKALAKLRTCEDLGKALPSPCEKLRDSSMSGYFHNQPPDYLPADSFECRRAKCVSIPNPQATKAMFTVTTPQTEARTKWKIRYREAMVNSLDNTLKKERDPKCERGIEKLTETMNYK